MEIIEMNKTLLLGGLAALALTLGAGAASAQQSLDRSTPRVHRADTDRDSRISRAEFVAARVDRLSAADADRDGSVTREERQVAARARMAERADVRFTRLDANSDGAISRAEFDAPREARADRGPRPARAHRGPAGRGHRMGHPDRAERGPIIIADARARAEQAFDRLDKDRDGVLTVEERREGRQALREQRRERRAERTSPQASASE